MNEARERVKAFCKEEGIPVADRSAVLRAMKTFDFSRLTAYQAFVGYDALGSCHIEADSDVHRLYEIFGSLWWLLNQRGFAKQKKKGT